ncbi:Ferric reductase transmembrane component 4 [Cercospora beticola]|nr:Ferric reductase transmembrane component 4 [Cercospora beticola]PIA94130.1 Ferric reductase transmembrane component 4 [Cercospora beticola]
MSMTSPQCQANDTALLTSLAYCMKEHCPADVTAADIEDYWGSRMLDTTGTVQAKWTYGEALAQVTEPPTAVFNSSSEDVLNQTVLAPKSTYEVNNRFNILFDHLEALQARYAFVIITIGFGTPILFSLLHFLPCTTNLLDKFKPYIVYPSLIGTYRMRSLPWLLGNAPTAGQALWIFMFFAINLVLSCVNYRTMPEGTMPWGFTKREELLAYIGYRTGHFGYMLLPLVILFSSRNNVLLWVTSWSYETYLLLHRWVARLFTLYAIIHSVTLLGTYTGSGSYPTASKEPYWLWGIVATVLSCAMLVFSMLWFRQKSYELFLIGHIVMAVFVLAGCWYHVILKWGYNFYDNWLYAAMAVWGFDRLMRLLRLLKNGVKHATVTEIDKNHVRIDIPDIHWDRQPGSIAFAYFPQLNKLRPWENHPFSVNATSSFQTRDHAIVSSGISSDGNSSSSARGTDEEKTIGVTVSSSYAPPPAAGLTFIVKKRAGLTQYLKSHASLLTLIDGPYPRKIDGAVLAADHLLLVGGGIGITGLVAWIHAHPNLKLAWSVRSEDQPLVSELDAVLEGVADKQVLVGERIDVARLLKSTAAKGYSKVGVVVCGPAGMCDDVRSKVARVGRGSGSATMWDLEVEAFSW